MDVESGECRVATRIGDGDRVATRVELGRRDLPQRIAYLAQIAGIVIGEVSRVAKWIGFGRTIAKPVVRIRCLRTVRASYRK